MRFQNSENKVPDKFQNIGEVLKSKWPCRGGGTLHMSFHLCKKYRMI